MKRKDYVDEEVKKTLSAFDDWESVDAPPFLETRILAGLESALESGSQSWFMRHATSLQLAAVSLLILLNIGVIWNSTSNNQSSTQSTEQLDAFAAEYSLDESSFEAFSWE